MTTLITLTNVGSDAGPFNLYSNADDYDQPFDTDISAAELIAGYTTSFVPNDATIIRVVSMGVCGNYINIVINNDPCLIVGTASFAITTTTTSTTGVPTTTTTTTICERPEGLTNGKLIKAYRIYEDPTFYFYSVSLVAAIGAFQIFRTETGTQTVDDHIQYSSLTIGEILYALWDNTNCEVVEDGYYWFQPNTDNSLTYFNNIDQINVVTVVGGEITAITPYTWIP